MAWDTRVGGGNATKTWGQIQTEVLDYTEGPHSVTAPSTTPALTVKQQGNAGASTSTGGAINLDNSGSTGAGIVVYSTQASPSGRLIVARANNPTFAQTAIYAENAGTGHALHAANTYSGSNGTGCAANFTSTNSGNSTIFVSGVELTRGTVKVTHTGTGTDAAAACISLDIAGNGTASQGIFIDATGTSGTTGDLMDLRNGGNQLFKLRSASGTISRPELQLGNGGPIWTFVPSGTPEGVVAGPPGSLCTVLTGGVGTTLYVKRSGTGNTGWFAVA